MSPKVQEFKGSIKAKAFKIQGSRFKVRYRQRRSKFKVKGQSGSYPIWAKLLILYIATGSFLLLLTTPSIYSAPILFTTKIIQKL
jgi:hypothetical protein